LSGQTRNLIEKIEALPAERRAEVEDFVDLLQVREQDRPPAGAAAIPYASALDRIWNNPDDDIYDVTFG
jgi:hypothetical protein